MLGETTKENGISYLKFLVWRSRYSISTRFSVQFKSIILIISLNESSRWKPTERIINICIGASNLCVFFRTDSDRYFKILGYTSSNYISTCFNKLPPTQKWLHLHCCLKIDRNESETAAVKFKLNNDYPTACYLLVFLDLFMGWCCILIFWRSSEVTGYKNIKFIFSA
jgi:hypothetical protein